jgi:mRNA interferase RelE/StbE
MSYQIIYDKPALKFLRKQPPDQQRRLVAAIHKLPGEGDIKPMAGRPEEYRLRVGSYRVLYTVHEQVLVVQVLSIGNRGDIYK